MEFSENTTKNVLKEFLEKAYPHRIELHAHTTPVSRCSQITPEEMAKTYSSLGYHAVTITNHFIQGMFMDKTKQEALDYYMKDFLDCKALEEKYGIKFYLGCEIRFENQGNNDYLIYGCNRDILETAYDYLDKDIESYRNEVKLEKSVFVQAHPFRDGLFRADASLLDGIESYNIHPGHNSKIGLAVKHAQKEGLEIQLCGSDFHHPERDHEGVAAIRTKILPSDSFELAEILRSKDYLLEIGGCSLILA